MSSHDKGVGQQQVQLKVLESYTRDVGRGVARLDYDAMDASGTFTGDVIEIQGKRRTVAKCLPLFPSDEGRGVIRVDGLIRNCGTDFGRCLESFESTLWSKDAQRQKQHFEQSGVEKGQYAQPDLYTM